MAAPINFSVAAAPRQGTFSTPRMVMPAGYATLFWQLSIPVTAQYENPANSFTAKVQIDPAGGTSYVDYQVSTWQGGPAVDRHGSPDPAPTISVDVSKVPVGSSVRVTVVVPNSMTIGIINGVLS